MTKDGDAIKKLETQLGAWGREDFHEMRNTLNTMVLTVAVIQERQQVSCQAIDRIEAMVAEIHDDVRDRVSSLETRVAVMAVTKPSEGIPSHQRSAILMAALGLGAALAGTPKWVIDAAKEWLTGKP